MTFDQIAQAMEVVAKDVPQYVPALLYVLLCSSKAEKAMASQRVPSETELMGLITASEERDFFESMAELISEFLETTRVAQSRIQSDVLPIVE